MWSLWTLFGLLAYDFSMYSDFPSESLTGNQFIRLYMWASLLILHLGNMASSSNSSIYPLSHSQLFSRSKILNGQYMMVNTCGLFLDILWTLECLQKSRICGLLYVSCVKILTGLC